MILNTSAVEIDESGISISKIDNIVAVRGSLQNHHAKKVKVIFSSCRILSGCAHSR